MKNKRSVECSAIARINQAIRQTGELNELLMDMRIKNKEDFLPNYMHHIRQYAEEILQCVHEYNAYTNVLLTE